MEDSNKFDGKKLWKSFGFALAGIREMLRTEQNARIHFLISLCVIIAGILFGISPAEWCFVALCIGMVFSAEAFNTVVEKLVDHLFPERHETARIAKDVAAGAVLVCALAAVACGILIFLPKLLELFHLNGQV